MAANLDRAATAAGVVAPAVLLLTVALGAASSPTYDWPAEPFSALGGPGRSTAAAFNAGLTLGGLAALPFASRLRRARSALVGGLYALVGLSFAGAGLFSVPSPLHEAFGAGAFVGIWLLLWVAAVADWRADARRDAAGAFLLGTAALAVWLPYDLGVARAQVGYGAAELVSLLAFAVWSVRTAARLLGADARRTPPNSSSGEVAK